MYSIVIGDFARLQTFLNSTGDDWLTFVTSEKAVLLMQSTSEVFSVLQLSSRRSAVDSDVSFRIKKRFLKIIPQSESIEMEFDREDVVLTFVYQNTRSTLCISHHRAFTSAMSEKMSVIQQCRQGAFDATCLGRVGKISSAFSSFLCVSGGVASVTARDGSKFFAKADGIPDLCLTPQSIHFLMQCSQSWFVLQNYVIAINGHYAVMATQCRGGGDAGYELREAFAQPSAAVFTVDLSRVFSLSTKLSHSSIELDVRKSLCIITDEEASIELTVEESDVKISDKFDKLIPIDNKVLTSVLSRLSEPLVRVSVKKYFNLLECGGITILCK